MRNLSFDPRFELGLAALDDVPQKEAFLRAVRWAVLTNPEALLLVPGSNPPIYIVKSDPLAKTDGSAVIARVWCKVMPAEVRLLVIEVVPTELDY